MTMEEAPTVFATGHAEAGVRILMGRAAGGPLVSPGLFDAVETLEHNCDRITAGVCYGHWFRSTNR